MTDRDILETQGDYRVSLVRDDSPEEPYDEGAPPIVEIPFDNYANPSFKNLGSYEPTEMPDILGAAGYFFGYRNYRKPYHQFLNDSEELLERYLKIFHGASKVGWHDSRDARYVTFDTADWRKHHGIEDTAKTDQDYQDSINLNEFKAWLEGDVYSYIVEKRAIWQKKDNPNETMETWDEVETLGGLYGYDQAKEAALEALDSYANTPTYSLS